MRDKSLNITKMHDISLKSFHLVFKIFCVVAGYFFANGIVLIGLHSIVYFASIPFVKILNKMLNEYEKV